MFLLAIQSHHSVVQISHMVHFKPMQFLVSVAQLVKWLSTRFISKDDYQKKGDLPLHHYVHLSSGAHAFYCAQDSERAFPDSKCGQRKNFTFNATKKKRRNTDGPSPP